VSVSRPRARTTIGGELQLDSWAVFADRDLLTQLVLERMLAGVATRRHDDVGEPVGTQLRARSVSKSAVSRRFVAATDAKLAELLARDLSGLEVAVLMVDGLFFAGCCIVVALVITADGTKVPAGIWDGDTENTIVVTGLLADLVDRGLRFGDGILVVVDGAKALRKAVSKVFGDRALVQRCTLHKRRINRPSRAGSTRRVVLSSAA
jgi:transposase-like protein